MTPSLASEYSIDDYQHTQLSALLCGYKIMLLQLLLLFRHSAKSLNA